MSIVLEYSENFNSISTTLGWSYASGPVAHSLLSLKTKTRHLPPRLPLLAMLLLGGSPLVWGLTQVMSKGEPQVALLSPWTLKRNTLVSILYYADDSKCCSNIISKFNLLVETRSWTFRKDYFEISTKGHTLFVACVSIDFGRLVDRWQNVWNVYEAN